MRNRAFELILIYFVTILKIATIAKLFNIKARSRFVFSMASSTNRITSYNVLSTHLGGPDYYQSCDPRWLNASYRIAKLKEKLDSETSSEAIICLQEVSSRCASELHPYFMKKGYYFVTGQYGNKFNNYMGVGIAVPLSKYRVNSLDVTRIADTKKEIPPLSYHPVVNLLQAFLIKPLISIMRLIGMVKPKFEPFKDALKRLNQMVIMRLSPIGATPESNKSFVVGTYHMPCMFDYPQVMVIHCALSAQHIQNYSQGDPYIFAGDFNVKPTDSMYRLLTQGDIDEKDPARPRKLPGDDWSPKVAPMRSAYQVHCGFEPKFTNWAKVKSQEPFIDTLDYIFLSPHWKVQSVLPLPELSDVPGPMPTAEEPSDHLLISAEITI